MPEMGGIEVASRIRNLEAAQNLPRVPIICLTGHEGSSLQKECTDNGVNMMFTKPIGRQKLQHALEELIRPSG